MASSSNDTLTRGTGVVLTVAEGKRLIAKAVVQLPEVRQRLRNGLVVIAKGTTNAYVVEELLGKRIDLMAYGSGVFTPHVPDVDSTRTGRVPIPDLVLRDGEPVADLDRFTAAEEFAPGDIYIKGANALDYSRQKAGIMIGASNGGTIGTVIGHVVGKSGQLIIPVGLEKLVYEDIDRLHRRLQCACSDSWRLFPVTGTIVTEIEALRALTGVDAVLAGAGGIGGAEGCVALHLSGTGAQVDSALALIEEVHGEPRIYDRQ